MQKEYYEIMQWIFNMPELALKLLIRMYNADLLNERYVLVLEAIAAMADD